jgi:hypothetical protein
MTRRETTMRQASTTAAARTVMDRTEPPGLDWRTVILRVAGAGLLIATGAIHLDPYLTGYRTIPAISRLLLLQAIAAFGLGPPARAIPSRLAAAGGGRLRPRRLPVGLDRAVRSHRGPYDRPHRPRPGGGGRFHGPSLRRIVPGTPRLGTTS